MWYAIAIPLGLMAVIGLLALGFRYLDKREEKRVSEEYEE